jgi:hypothetical protein
MPTNNIKHLMLREAKRIANKYKDIANRDIDELSRFVFINQVNNEVKKLLKDHPEFDEDAFEEMIKTFQQSKINPKYQLENEY